MLGAHNVLAAYPAPGLGPLRGVAHGLMKIKD
jgi:hypothetical protein